MDMLDNDQLWMVITGFIVAFLLAFGIGANDVANSFGTSVGSKVLTMAQACILASIFETLGAVLLGAKVSDTIRKGIIDVAPYNGTEEVLMVGNVSALVGSCIWLLFATFLRLPVSATHSIVGATVGFALVAHGGKGVQWRKIGLVIGSWFISPILSGVVSCALFVFIRFFILNKVEKIEPGLKFMPIFYAFTIMINLISILFVGSDLLGFNKIPVWGVFIISFGVGIIIALLIRIVIVPWLRKKIIRECDQKISEAQEEGEIHSVEASPEHKTVPQDFYHQDDSGSIHQYDGTKDTQHLEMATTDFQNSNNAENILENSKNLINHVAEKSMTTKPLHTSESQKPLLCSVEKMNTSSNSTESTALDLPSDGKKLDDSGSPFKSDELEKKRLARENIQDSPETIKIFSFLQILTAIFGAFAHGGNDVSNAIGPLVALWAIYSEGTVHQKLPTPIWLLLYGGVGISIGLWVWGRRVIKTMGEDLSKITPSSGFCIEIGSALTVLIASNIGIPISTTHCKVGSVVMVGRVRLRETVDWRLFRNIVFAWLITLPVSGGISAGIMACLQMLL